MRILPFDALKSPIRGSRLTNPFSNARLQSPNPPNKDASFYASIAPHSESHVQTPDIHRPSAPLYRRPHASPSSRPRRLGLDRSRSAGKYHPLAGVFSERDLGRGGGPRSRGPQVFRRNLGIRGKFCPRKNPLGGPFFRLVLLCARLRGRSLEVHRRLGLVFG